MMCQKSKLEIIISTFALYQVSLSRKSRSKNLKLWTAKLVIRKEIQSEHLEKKKLKKDLQSICIQLESVSDLLLCHVLLHSVYFAVKSAQKVILKGHEKKLIKFYN